MLEEKLGNPDENFSYNRGYGYEQEEDSELWVADFGSHDVEESLREELTKLKPKTPKYISWALTSLGLLLVVLVWESLIRLLAQRAFWSELSIYWASWLWRLIILLVWFYIAKLKWLLDWRRLFIMTLISFTLAVVVLDVVKIFYIKSAWTWLNLLVEPIWMALVVALVGTIFYKFVSRKNNK